MLTHAFPSLAENNAQTSNTRKELERLKLPASFKTRTINNYGTFTPIGVQILERLDKCTAGCHIIVGVDAEWDALTTEDKRDPHPATLQLALADGSIVVGSVAHNSYVFTHQRIRDVILYTFSANYVPSKEFAFGSESGDGHRTSR
jgi:hypothetical protein